ncbi:dapdiamide synthesis protein DdaC-like [Saccoglossus kowalevskii]|uniref:Clavaminate synthase-like protein At3g21360-like n=1 Tax=Saccoglossus kowalevskii TaxID=10224 RepID=A0ABM0GTY0_SACKO|nr:PREDICTED: clavaminate synthase-like protein At3g21360-like [Saccoglossus kowalevskii]
MFTASRILPHVGKWTVRHQSRQLSSTGPVYVRAAFVHRELLDTHGTKPGRLAGREWLPGASSPDNRFPEFISPPSKNFPAVYEAKYTDTSIPPSDWAKVAKEVIDANLTEYGAILFRGMPINGGDRFSQFLVDLGYETMGYEGGLAVRQKVAPGVLTASDDLPEVTIQPHNEMGYRKTFPKKLFFSCEIAPEPGCGGETGITRVKDIEAKLKPEVKEKFRKLGINYHFYLHSIENSRYKSWQETFFTENKSDVEKYMDRMNYEHKWQDDGAVSYWYTLPAFTKHHKTGEELWFNHVHRHHSTNLAEHPKYADEPDLPPLRFPYHTGYGDGTELEPEVLQHLRDVIWQVSVGFQLQKSDIIVFDNMLVQHSRLGFTGKRKLLAAMTTD